jgi:hypothetical protein
MLIQSFEPPRKLHSDLGAGVSAGAVLQGSGLVALMTTRPVRLLVQPEGGAEGLSVDVSIESAQEIALLSKDVAVVLDGEHVLWAVSDLHAAVKLKPIARDVRALAARSHGESALAAGMDGKARAVTLSRGAVTSRAFGLRGGLRACDIGEQLTYAVVDGKSGGQLRIHPGVTPELGTSARVALPEGAAGLDRVRGGQKLTAVYARGEATVCVVRGPAPLAAKVVQLEAKPADVAVLDRYLLVAYSDGRLALYDGEAILRAGDAPLTATNVVALGGNGKPQVILAGVGKAGPALWVGTSTGEVFCVELHDVSAEAAPRPRAEPAARAKAAPEPSAEARASAQEALAREFAAKEAAWAERERALIAERDRQKDERKALERKLAEAEEQVRAQEAELAKRTAEYDGLQGEFDALESRLGMAEEQTRGWSAEIMARTEERDGLLAELEALHLRLEMTEEQTRTQEAELSTRTTERDQQKLDLETSQGELVSALEQVRAREAELTARTKELDGSQAELDRLRAEEIERKREQNERQFLGWGDGRSSFGRARGRLDSVISQVHSVLFRRSRD